MWLLDAEAEGYVRGRAAGVCGGGRAENSLGPHGGGHGASNLRQSQPPGHP